MSYEYNPIVSVDNSMHLKEPSLGTYKALKMITLKSVVASPEDKARILQEFRLPAESVSDELGIEEYYRELFLALFLESIKYRDVDTDDLNIAEINRAVSDFFSMLGGN